MTKLTETEENPEREMIKLQLFERKLFDLETSTEVLEEICMSLAHTPTKEAQELLKKFAESERADEVGWLFAALDEGQYHYLCPENDQEEKDFLAAKLVLEIEDDIIELEMKIDEIKDDTIKHLVEYEAVQTLVKKGELDTVEEYVLHDVLVGLESNLEEIKNQLDNKRKIVKQVKTLIKTPKYKDTDYQYLKNIH